MMLKPIPLKSYQDFLDFFDDTPNSERVPFIYRGVNSAHSIIPSICHDNNYRLFRSMEEYEKWLLLHF